MTGRSAESLQKLNHCLLPYQEELRQGSQGPVQYAIIWSSTLSTKQGIVPDYAQHEMLNQTLLKGYISSYKTAEETALDLMTSFRQVIKELDDERRPSQHVVSQPALFLTASGNDTIRLERIKIRGLSKVGGLSWTIPSACSWKFSVTGYLETAVPTCLARWRSKGFNRKPCHDWSQLQQIMAASTES